LLLCRHRKGLRASSSPPAEKKEKKRDRKEEEEGVLVMPTRPPFSRRRQWWSLFVELEATRRRGKGKGERKGGLTCTTTEYTLTSIPHAARTAVFSLKVRKKEKGKWQITISRLSALVTPKPAGYFWSNSINQKEKKKKKTGGGEGDSGGETVVPWAFSILVCLQMGLLENRRICFSMTFPQIGGKREKKGGRVRLMAKERVTQMAAGTQKWNFSAQKGKGKREGKGGVRFSSMRAI